jgi:hypothetical protein
MELARPTRIPNPSRWIGGLSGLIIIVRNCGVHGKGKKKERKKEERERIKYGTGMEYVIEKHAQSLEARS